MRYPLTTTTLFAAAAMFLSAAAVPLLAQEEKQLTAEDILKYARDSITAATGKYEGFIIRDNSPDPFVADFSGNGVVYYFSNPKETVQARAGGTPSGDPAKSVRDSNVTMEDLSMSFLSWPATAVDEEMIAGRKNYRVNVKNPGSKGAYNRAIVWLDRKTLGLSKVEAYGRSGGSKEIRIWNYKKFGEQYLPGKVTITDRDSAGKKGASTSIQISEQRS